MSPSKQSQGLIVCPDCEGDGIQRNPVDGERELCDTCAGRRAIKAYGKQAFQGSQGDLFSNTANHKGQGQKTPQNALECGQKGSGRTRMKAGVSAVWNAHQRSRWSRLATAAMDSLAFEGMPFTSDDLRERVGDPPTPNLLGAVFSRAAKEGAIARTSEIKTSSRPSAHARRLPVWIGTQN